MNFSQYYKSVLREDTQNGEPIDTFLPTYLSNCNQVSFSRETGQNFQGLRKLMESNVARFGNCNRVPCEKGELHF